MPRFLHCPGVIVRVVVIRGVIVQGVTARILRGAMSKSRFAIIFSSVASVLVFGGQDPEMYRQKIYLLILRERAKEASASETYIFRTQLHLHTYTINAVSFNYLWYGATHYTDKTLTLRKIYEYASERSERA